MSNDIAFIFKLLQFTIDSVVSVSKKIYKFAGQKKKLDYDNETKFY